MRIAQPFHFVSVEMQPVFERVPDLRHREGNAFYLERKTMKNTTRFARPLLLGLALATMGAAHAQPNANNGAGAQNPPNQNAGGRRGGRGEMTAEQQAQMRAQMQQMRELGVRQMLTRGGFTDAALQDAVVAYSNERNKATEALQDKARQLNEALRGTTATDAQLATLLNDFRAAVEEEKARREVAQSALDAKIGLAAKPRLDALLMMAGFIGDEAQYLGGGGGRGPGGFGGFDGGPGGFAFGRRGRD